MKIIFKQPLAAEAKFEQEVMEKRAKMVKSPPLKIPTCGGGF